MAHGLPSYRHLGPLSISQALEHRDVKLNEDHFNSVREAVDNVQRVLEANLRLKYDAGADAIEKLYVAEGFYEHGVVVSASIRGAIFEKAGVTDPAVREAVQYTHKAEAERTRAYASSKRIVRAC